MKQTCDCALRNLQSYYFSNSYLFLLCDYLCIS